MKKLLLITALIFLLAPFAWAEKYALIILPEVGPSPTCVDPEECTAEELEVISEWQDSYDNLWGLYGKIQKNEGWLFGGECVDIVYPGKGVRVTKAGQYGTAVWFLMDRILKPDPTAWFVNKVAIMRANGWDFRGYATDEAHQELADRNYEIWEAPE